VIIENRTGDTRIAVEILQPPYFGPGRINAKRCNRQQQIYDPDAEVFGAGAGEFKTLRPDNFRYPDDRSRNML
jgi:hypothetical protein